MDVTRLQTNQEPTICPDAPPASPPAAGTPAAATPPGGGEIRDRFERADEPSQARRLAARLGGPTARYSRDGRVAPPASDRAGPPRETDLLSPPGARWDGAAILRHFGQRGSPLGDHQGVRCGAAAEVASAVMNGPAATHTLIRRLLRAVASDPEARRALVPIQQRSAEGRLRYADLHALQEIAYRRFDVDGYAGLTPDEVHEMQARLADRPRAEPRGSLAEIDGAVRVSDGRLTTESPALTRARIEDLEPGQSLILFVDTDANNAPNHFVAVGRDRDGRVYLHDPDPPQGQAATLLRDRDRAEFDRYLDASLGYCDGGAAYNLIAGHAVQDFRPHAAPRRP